MPNKRLQCIFTYYKSQYRLLLLQIRKYVTNYLSHLFNIIIIGLKGVLKAMNKKAKTGILALISATIILLAMSCENLTITITGTNPNGYVYDTNTGSALSGATVSLSGIGNTRSYTDTTNSSGYYSFSSNVEYGKYEITATKTGYTFIKQIVEVSSDSALPNIGGFDSTSTASSTLTIITFWDRNFKDVDAHLSYPDSAKGRATFSNTDFYTPIGSPSTGFAPATTGRTFIYHANPTETDAQLDVDNKGDAGDPPGGPETVTITGITSYYSAYDGTNIYASSGSSDPSGLPAGNYTCIGIMEYYLNAPGTDKYLSSASNSNVADPKVYVFSGTTQIGSYSLPKYTDLKSASVLRINTFVSSSAYYYQILPDIKLESDDPLDFRGSSKTAPMVVKGDL